ncbi:hypothetical protein EZS27_000855 [termite gut metagenome]|uniref:VanZ-like domain-containing protein n=1 Tax=termite gut metagenome TaxID=433724 RepID=A0A5J4T2Q5_9ZZZZ
MYYIRKYPVSLIVMGIIVFLSLFNPPTIKSIYRIPNWDKIIHLCMYGALSGILWWEFLRNHKNGNFPILHVWIGAIVCPIVFSGVVELLQKYCTTYRGGDWLDFVADIIGVIVGSLISHYVIRPWMNKH